MTTRYDLLIQSMRAASDTVLLTFVFSMMLIGTRAITRRMVSAPGVPVFFQTLMYNVADVMLVAPILALFILSQ